MPEHIDAKWFPLLQPIIATMGETFTALYPSEEYSQTQHAAFANANYALDISFIKHDMPTPPLTRALQDLALLAARIDVEEQNVYVRDAYILRIKELSAQCRLMLAGASGDKASFVEECQTIYGRPDAAIYGAVCSWIRSDAQSALSDPILAPYALEVLRVLPSQTGDVSILQPSGETFAKVQKIHQQADGYYHHLFGKVGLPDAAYIDQQFGDQICRDALTAIGADYSIEDATNGIWSVSQSLRAVYRPPGYRLDRDEFIGIVCHEIGSHVLESVNGAGQTLQLLSAGLDRFEAGNEGRAFLREQIAYESSSVALQQASWEYIAMLHFGVSLGSGCDRNTPYGFAKLYDTFYRIFAFWRQRRFPHATNNDIYAREEAWLLAVRICKGTDGASYVYAKDLVYLEGVIACWRAAENDPAIILKGDIGKFDITNARHLEILKGLDIL